MEKQKSYIIMETPKNCRQCILQQRLFGNTHICGKAQKSFDIRTTEKPDWCPLKSIPNKKDYTPGMKDSIDDYNYLVGKMDGWNNCIDELLK